MARRLLTIRTSDGVEIQYPLNFLKGTCTTIDEALAEALDGDIEVPFTSGQFDSFLELLETRRLPSSIEAVFASLEIADYMALRLTQTELQTLLIKLDLDGLEQADEFLAEAGFKELSPKAIHHLLSHKTDLISFKGLTAKKRLDRFCTIVLAKEKLKGIELIGLLVPVVPQILRCHLTFLLESTPDSEIEIPKEYFDKLKMILPIAQGFLFKEEPEPTPPVVHPPVEILVEEMEHRQIGNMFAHLPEDFFGRAMQQANGMLAQFGHPPAIPAGEGQLEHMLVRQDVPEREEQH